MAAAALAPARNFVIVDVAQDAYFTRAPDGVCAIVCPACSGRLVVASPADVPAAFAHVAACIISHASPSGGGEGDGGDAEAVKESVWRQCGADDRAGTRAHARTHRERR
jgi:hypothetical protein